MHDCKMRLLLPERGGAPPPGWWQWGPLCQSPVDGWCWAAPGGGWADGTASLMYYSHWWATMPWRLVVTTQQDLLGCCAPSLSVDHAGPCCVLCLQTPLHTRGLPRA